MEKTDSESSRSDGQPRPPLQKLQGSENELQTGPTSSGLRPAGPRPGNFPQSGEGEVVRVFSNVPPEKLAVVEQLLDGESGPDGPTGTAASQRPPGTKKNWKSAGAGLVVVVMLAAAGALAHHGSPGGQHRGHKPISAHTAQAASAGRRRASKEEANPQLRQMMLELQDIKKLLAEVHGGATGRATGVNQQSQPHTVETNRLQTLGRWQFSRDFKDVWLGDEHYDLRGRAKARFCIQYLVTQQAFDANSARHLETEIDPFVREKCRLPPPEEIRIQHYFNDRSGKLARLRRELVKSAGRNGRFYLQVV